MLLKSGPWFCLPSSAISHKEREGLHAWKRGHCLRPLHSGHAKRLSYSTGPEAFFLSRALGPQAVSSTLDFPGPICIVIIWKQPQNGHSEAFGTMSLRGVRHEYQPQERQTPRGSQKLSRVGIQTCLRFQTLPPPPQKMLIFAVFLTTSSHREVNIDTINTP